MASKGDGESRKGGPCTCAPSRLHGFVLWARLGCRLEGGHVARGSSVPWGARTPSIQDLSWDLSCDVHRRCLAVLPVPGRVARGVGNGTLESQHPRVQGPTQRGGGGLLFLGAHSPIRGLTSEGEGPGSLMHFIDGLGSWAKVGELAPGLASRSPAPGLGRKVAGAVSGSHPPSFPLTREEGQGLCVDAKL